ncbi:MAG TPA: SGNH/GDSL hydrolase family protein [Opitutaceae bacterium]|nr:SGNH/GDSL hydrolase family protein [Opitutaceae bacterium]
MLKKITVVLTVLLLGSATLASPAKWAGEITALVKNDATSPPPANAVVFVGSSSIVRWDSLAQNFPAVKTINRGFGGSYLADSVFYADRIVIPYKPRIVVVYAGDNDLNDGKSPTTVAEQFVAFRTKIHAALPDTRIVFIAIKPSPARWEIREKAIKANKLIAADCATDKQRLAFANIWPAMLGADGQPRPELYVEDKLHLSPAGYAVWTPLIAPLLK